MVRETGLLDAGRLEGALDRAGAGRGPTKASQPAPMLRGTFAVRGPVRSARAYVTSLGLYELEINGRRVGDQLFTPGLDELQASASSTRPTTSPPCCAPATNAIGAMLGDGWYRGYLAWNDRRNVYGDRLALLCQLRIEYADGRVETIGTDETWKAATGPIRASDIYMRRDLRRAARAARLERARLRRRRTGRPCASAEPPKHVLVAPAGPPVRRDRGDAAGQDPAHAGRRDGLRHGPEHGRPRAPEGARAGRHDGRRCATPRCSTRPATSTPRTCARRSSRSRTR